MPLGKNACYYNKLKYFSYSWLSILIMAHAVRLKQVIISKFLEHFVILSST